MWPVKKNDCAHQNVSLNDRIAFCAVSLKLPGIKAVVFEKIVARF